MHRLAPAKTGETPYFSPELFRLNEAGKKPLKQEIAMKNSAKKVQCAVEANQLWNTGIPTQNAHRHFAPTELEDRYEKYGKKSVLECFQNAALEVSQQKMPGITAITRVLQDSQPEHQQRLAAIHEFNAFILAQLQSGELRCFGFETPRSIHDIPVEVPKHFWKRAPDLATGILQQEGIHLIELRLQRGSSPTMSDVGAKPGRPTIKWLVTMAFEALLAEEQINPSASAKSHFPLVRHWIQQNDSTGNYDENRPSDEGIRAHFSPLFNELNRKSSKDRKQ